MYFQHKDSSRKEQIKEETLLITEENSRKDHSKLQKDPLNNHEHRIREGEVRKKNNHLKSRVNQEDQMSKHQLNKFRLQDSHNRQLLLFHQQFRPNLKRLKHKSEKYPLLNQMQQTW